MTSKKANWSLKKTSLELWVRATLTEENTENVLSVCSAKEEHVNWSQALQKKEDIWQEWLNDKTEKG